MPAVVVLAWLTGLGAPYALASTRARLAGVAFLVAGAALPFADPAIRMARRERWEWEGEAIAEMLRAAYEVPAPLLAVDAAGCLPYWSGLWR